MHSMNVSVPFCPATQIGEETISVRSASTQFAEGVARRSSITFSTSVATVVVP